MLLKIRYAKTLTYEACVEVPSGLGRAETLKQAEDAADDQDSWKQVGESDSETEIVEEYGKIPTIREDK
jgi:hypothetical protein